MAEEMVIKRGADRVIAIRLLEDKSKVAADLLAFEVEHSSSKSRDYDTIKTKSGNVVNLSEVEYELSTVSYIPVGSEKVAKYEDAFDEGKPVEVWVINKDEEVEEGGKFKSSYRQAYITSFEPSANVEDLVELNMEFAVYGREQKGDATLTEEQLNVLQYKFRDTVVDSE